MIRGKCIYCKEEKDLNREHAFPETLLDDKLRGTKHEWIIDKHLCQQCNSNLGKLDMILGKRSCLAFTLDRIQDELCNKNETLHSSIYRKRAAGVNPVRFFAPDPLYDNHILLHERATMSDDTSIPVDSRTALRPQIILTQYPEGQTSEAVIAENCEKFNAATLNEDIITDYGEQKEIYCILGNTYIFPPKAAEYFFHRVTEFKSRFLTDFPRTRYDLRVIFPEKDRYQGAVETFCNSLVGKTKEIIEDEKIPDPQPVIQLIEVRADQTATPLIARAIAKIAFHCLLYHYPEFNGHEPIFENIKEFIYTGSSNRFVGEWKDPGTENIVYDSDEHFHYICFFLQGNDIGCRIDLFTGLQDPPISYQVILAGDPDNSHPSPNRMEYIPFYVHPKSQIKRRIVLVDRLSTIVSVKSEIWTPN